MTTTTTTATASRLININRPRRNYLRMTMRACIALPLITAALCITAAIAQGTYAGITRSTAPGLSAPGDSITVTGCPSEDSCTIDYSGDGSWTITLTTP